MQTSEKLRWLSLLLVAFLWTGCQPQSGSEASAPSAPPSEEALVILAGADAVDGTEDQVVSKCLTCSLGMDGSSAHASKFGPYELRLCSAACKKSFDADPEQAVLATPVPGAAE